MIPSSLLRILACFLLVTPSVTADTPGQASPKKPNVLFISIDDLRPELNCYGASHIKSPNIDRLAAEGVLFKRAHVQQAICMASRASIMSGLRPERKGIYTGESVEDTVPSFLTLNEFFAKNGYDVSSAGKIYHHREDTKAQFPGDQLLKLDQEGTGQVYASPEGLAIKAANKESHHGPAFESADVDDLAYVDGANAQAAIDHLAKRKDSDQPFFMAVGFYRPHLPFNAPQKYWDLYPEASISLPERTTLPENSSKQTMRLGGEIGSYVGMPQKFAQIDEPTTKTLRRGYYAAVSYVDAQVGKLLDSLEENGLRESTIIVLWGDHGFKLGDYGLWCKWSNMQIDTRVPLIFSIPGGAKGLTSNRVTEVLDLYPTLADLCGLRKPTHLDGKSLKKHLENPTVKQTLEPDLAYTVWPHNRWNYEKTKMGFSVKDGRFNYVEWIRLDGGKVIARELYDHEKDPLETKNVIKDEIYRQDLARLANYLDRQKAWVDHDHKLKALR